MFNRLKLAPKFILILSFIFLLAIVVTGSIFANLLKIQTEAEMLSRGHLLMAAMKSVKQYTHEQVTPLLEDRIREKGATFAPEIVPAYSARQVFENLRQMPEYRQFSYKEAVLNPTNPDDQADEFEAQLVAQFRQDPDLEVVGGLHKRLGEEIFYQAIPIQITEESCLRCHGSPEKAPQSMIDRYGTKGGFGWKLNEIVGVQIAFVPSGEVIAIARKNALLIMGTLTGIFTLIAILIQFLLRQTVVKPIRPMARLAHRLSSDDLKPDPAGEADLQLLGKYSKSSDEIGQLARIFERMAQTVYARNQSFSQQVEQLGMSQKAKNLRTSVKTIEREYYRALQKKSRFLRGKSDSEH